MSIRFSQGKLKGEERQSIIQEIQRQAKAAALAAVKPVFTAFLEAVGLRRTWDLRGYSGQALALLTNRRLAYSYRYIERFLAELARVGADEVLTQALAGWTASLWKRQPVLEDRFAPVFYIDGHRKAVYADSLIPRGLVGRLEKILGCRAHVVLHDQEGPDDHASRRSAFDHWTASDPHLPTSKPRISSA